MLILQKKGVPLWDELPYPWLQGGFHFAFDLDTYLPKLINPEIRKATPSALEVASLFLNRLTRRPCGTSL